MQRNWLIIMFFASVTLLLYSSTMPSAAEKTHVLKMSTTTSTENSGLLNVLLPVFITDTGIHVKVFAKGTGAALRDGMEGNVDVVLVHAKKREDKFLAEGYGAYRLQVMHNDFVIVGPASDPAGIRGMKDTVAALERIAARKAKFVSRGDDSGTHIKEQELWLATGLKLKSKETRIVKKGKKKSLTFKYPGGLGRWYLSIGQGMGKTLTYAEEKRAYTLSDRGTFLKYKYGRKQGLDLEILCEGDPRLYNPYGVIPINPKRFPFVRFDLADRFAKWLISPKAQALIASYRIAGQQVFFPEAIPSK